MLANAITPITRSHQLSHIFAAAIGSAALIGVSHAAVLAFDNFDTTEITGGQYVHDATLDGVGYGFGWDGNWSASDTEAEYVTNAKNGVSSSASGSSSNPTTGWATRGIAGLNLPTSGQVWFSSKIHHTNINYEQMAYFGLFDSGGVLVASIGESWNDGGPVWALTTDDGNTITTGSARPSSWQTMVGVVDYDNNVITMWAGDLDDAAYNPDSGYAEGYQAQAFFAGSANPIESIQIYKEGYVRVRFDDITIANDQGDLGIAITSIPEPTVSLLGAGALMFFFHRRR